MTYDAEFFETCQFIADELGKDPEHIQELVAKTGLNLARELLRDLSIVFTKDSFTYKQIGYDADGWLRMKMGILYEYLQRSSLRY